MKRLLLAVALLLASSFALAAVNINTATKEELDALPGIGPVKAQAIIDYRSANGPFKTPEDVMKVRGIKQGEFGKIKDQITVSGATTPVQRPAGTKAAAPAAPPRTATPSAAAPAAPSAPAASSATAPAAPAAGAGNAKMSKDEAKAARAKAREEKAAKAKEEKEAKAKAKAEKGAKAKEEKAAKAEAAKSEAKDKAAADTSAKDTKAKQ